VNKKYVYLDHAATTPLHPRVLEKMLPFLKDNFGNPSSQHSFGRKVRVAIEEARETIADFINAKPGEISFVSGGTEANNFVIRGISKCNLAETGKTSILTTKAEHHCVLDTMEQISKYGLNVNFLPVQNDGTLSTQSLAGNLHQHISMASVIHINNETGSINNIKELCECVHQYGGIFHSDAVQSFGKVHIDVNEIKIDALCFSSHKIGGPKGIGAAYVRSGTPIEPLIFGGSQERNRRGGTENVPGIIGFAEAIRILRSEMMDNQLYIKKLNEYFRKGITEIDAEGIFINSPSDGLPNILSVGLKSSVYNTDPEGMLMYLDVSGIAASSGSACTSGTLKPSHVIMAMGKSKEDAQGTIRFSFGAMNTLEELDYALEILKQLTKKFRK